MYFIYTGVQCQILSYVFLIVKVNILVDCCTFKSHFFICVDTYIYHQPRTEKVLNPHHSLNWVKGGTRPSNSSPFKLYKTVGI